MLFSRKKYSDWREIQDEFDNYKASLDFESVEIAKDYILEDYDVSEDLLTELLEPIERNETEVVELKW